MDKRTAIAVILGVIIPLCTVLFIANNQHQLPANEFRIVLTKTQLNVVTDADVRYYNATSHELSLTKECANTLKAMKEPLVGDFMIIIDGEEDLHGIFVPPITSRSYPSTEVVITYPNFESNYETMKIQMGYPWDQPIGQDPRANSKILQHFEETGRLIR
jgi:hypothetical protein